MDVLPWYIAGPLLGLIIPILLILNEKQLGVSSSLRVVGSYIAPRMNYFKYKRKQDSWQLFFVFGLIAAAIVFHFFEGTVEPERIGDGKYVAISKEIYSLNNWLLFLLGGVCIGFGARYAGGCTAGHCLMGNSLLATSSIVTTASFFVGGLLVSHLLIPYIYS